MLMGKHDWGGFWLNAVILLMIAVPVATLMNDSMIIAGVFGVAALLRTYRKE